MHVNMLWKWNTQRKTKRKRIVTEKERDARSNGFYTGVQTTYWLEGEIPSPSNQIDKVVAASKMKRSTSEHDFFLKVKGRDRAASMQFNNNPLYHKTSPSDKPREGEFSLVASPFTVVSDDPLTMDDPLDVVGVPPLVDGLFGVDGRIPSYRGDGPLKTDGPYYV